MTPFALDHPAVQSYLRRLDIATAHLPVDERLDIVDGIRSHLLTVMAEAETEADVHRALDALGSPEEIVGSPPPAPQAPFQMQMPPQAPPGSARGVLEIVAVIFLLAGAFIIPLAGWIVGVVLLWVSKAWTTGEKWLGTLVLPGGLAATYAAVILGPFALPFSGDCTREPIGGRGGGFVESCSPGMAPGWLVTVVVVISAIVPILTAVYLLKAAGRRPAPTPNT